LTEENAVERLILLAAALAVSSGMASAQPVVGSKNLSAGQASQVEAVTVEGERLWEEQIKAFVETRATPTFQTGKVPRWETGICPVVAGLNPHASDFIAQRIKDLAVKAGAPVSRIKSCSPNIEIIFTTAPQALLDGVLKEHQFYLGYHDNGSQAAELARFNGPIAAWYATQTVDVHNNAKLDSGAPGLKTGTHRSFFTNSDGTGQLYDGHRSAFYHVIIVVDPGRIADREIGSLADYIAYVGLTQTKSLKVCASLPSVLDMFVDDCGRPRQASGITSADLSFLQGVYRSTGDRSFSAQEQEIGYQMQQAMRDR
jgi:hypothetical protein